MIHSVQVQVKIDRKVVSWFQFEVEAESLVEAHKKVRAQTIKDLSHHLGIPGEDK